MSDTTHTGPVLAADGTPLKRSLRRALRAQKLRALALIAPLLLFVLLTFIAPIADMLFRSVENQITGKTLPMTVEELRDWDGTGTPDERVYRALFFDLFFAAEGKEHTKLGSRLNYEESGISSMFRTTGRDVDDMGKVYQKAFKKLDPAFDEGAFWYDMMSGGQGAEGNTKLLSNQIGRLEMLESTTFKGEIGFVPGAEIYKILPNTTRAYTAFAAFTFFMKNDVVAEEDPWEAVYPALALDLAEPATVAALADYQGPGAQELRDAAAQIDTLPPVDMKAAFAESNKDWLRTEYWQVIKAYSPPYTTGYFLNAIDMEKTPDGIALRSEDERIYGILFKRTMFMSMVITFSCIALGYPIAWIMANLPARSANLLMILVLLPFWTSLLVRTSAWKIMLQQQGVINDVLVWLGLVADESRLVMINNQFGTIVAMTHILLPFMILPMYSVMQTIPQTYLRAAKSLGANNWTAFWRVYFPQSVPGIGAGSILVFILAIGYYITPEIVGGTTGTFISNRIAYHISSSLNWGLGAALGSILLAVVMVLYYAYDKIVGIDNVKLG
ncbi:putative spermidine/putrescine transport system permease protein [Roseovarius marisflavi]|uniref:Putative spermidine/putrescine transport system permease protein n=1 Tax=Roseovarius marisflavi TaxID=1054996 RepID=A0A1M6Y1G5_9RHOB|nr:ABC transporter permease [Roseovarius marisflavi]SHL11989.1 putative spermidine/putrescine transport system permease protein [Roseovarius marisflavi]